MINLSFAKNGVTNTENFLNTIFNEENYRSVQNFFNRQVEQVQQGAIRAKDFFNNNVFTENNCQNAKNFFNREFASIEALERFCTTLYKAACYVSITLITVGFLTNTGLIWMPLSPIAIAKFAFGSYLVNSLIGRVTDLAADAVPENEFGSEIMKIGVKVTGLIAMLFASNLLMPTVFRTGYYFDRLTGRFARYRIPEDFITKITRTFDVLAATSIPWNVFTSYINSKKA